MGIIEILRAAICKKIQLPIWAHGLECGICQMTFISAEAHQDHARRQRTIKKHTGKIPKITCGEM